MARRMSEITDRIQVIEHTITSFNSLLQYLAGAAEQMQAVSVVDGLESELLEAAVGRPRVLVAKWRPTQFLPRGRNLMILNLKMSPRATGSHRLYSALGGLS